MFHLEDGILCALCSRDKTLTPLLRLQGRDRIGVCPGAWLGTAPPAPLLAPRRRLAQALGHLCAPALGQNPGGKGEGAGLVGPQPLTGAQE